MKKFYLNFLIILFATTAMAFGEISGQMYKKTIAIDLDGVLDEYTGKYDENSIPKIKDGARDFIIKLSKDYDLVLFTTRKLMLATKWLIDNKIDKYFSDVTNVKPPAFIYLDDRALKFNGNYDDTLNAIKNYKVYWKN